jgi:hypothetical protein
VPWDLFAVASAAYLLQAAGLLIVGDAYLARGWADQYNYVAIADFVRDVRFDQPVTSALPPHVLLAIAYRHMRIGQSVLHAFFSAIGADSTKALFEPTIIWPVFLVVLATFSTIRAMGLPRALALCGALLAGLLPAIAYVHLESFLSQALALPFLVYIVVLCHRVRRTDATADYVMLAAVFAATTSMYIEIFPIAAGCAGLLIVSNALRSPLSWARLGRCGLVLVAPFALRMTSGLVVVLSGIDRPVLGVIYPWAFHIEGIQRVWFGDLVNDALFRGAPLTRLMAVALTALGMLGIVWHAMRVAVRWTRRDDAASADLLMAAILTVFIALPWVILVRDRQHPYQFYKLLLTFSPFLCCGLIAGSFYLTNMVATWTPARGPGQERGWAAGGGNGAFAARARRGDRAARRGTGRMGNGRHPRAVDLLESQHRGGAAAQRSDDAAPGLPRGRAVSRRRPRTRHRPLHVRRLFGRWLHDRLARVFRTLQSRLVLESSDQRPGLDGAEPGTAPPGSPAGPAAG